MLNNFNIKAITSCIRNYDFFKSNFHKIILTDENYDVKAGDLDDDKPFGGLYDENENKESFKDILRETSYLQIIKY